MTKSEDEKAAKADKKPQTVVLEADGMIVPQSKEVQKCLDSEIIGESESANGCKYLVTRLKIKKSEDSKAAKQIKIACLHFNHDGKAKIVKIFTEFIETLNAKLKLPQCVVKIMKQAKLDVKKLKETIELSKPYEKATKTSALEKMKDDPKGREN